MKNQEVAHLFAEIADALELRGENRFRVIAYRQAARAIESLTEDIETLARTDRLREIPGIGEGTSEKIQEYLKTGKVQRHEEAVEGLSEKLLELLQIQGLGPKTLAQAHQELKVNDVDDLKRVIEDGSFAALPGMGARKIDNIRKGMEQQAHTGKRISLDRALQISEEIIARLKQLPGVKEVTAAGSLRRCRESIGDIDILATGADPKAIAKAFTELPEVKQVLGAGDTKASVLVKSIPRPVQVDLRVLAENEYGSALQYFTGSKEHNVKLRTIARARGLKLSEYGVFRGEKFIAGKTEKEVYAAVGMPVMPPEIRENRGEIEAAIAGRLPHLVELEDIRGDLHCHTRRSDGNETIEHMARAAIERGYEYLAITDHTRTAAYAGGLSVDELKKSMAEIDEANSDRAAGWSSGQVNERQKGRGRPIRPFRILKGAEVDILLDGKLDYPDRVLAELDVVVASIHQGFKKNVTERIGDALANPHVDILAHPSGRLISRREGYDVDLEKVLESARRHKKVLELNSYPDRLDLSDVWLRRAKEMGVRIAINTDAHGIGDLGWIRYGVATARRGWLEKRDVLNCLSLAKLRKTLGGEK